MKKETLEEAAENRTKCIPSDYFSFIAGAKWQEERMYSEEDMKLAFKAGFSNGFASDILSTEKLQKEKERLFKEWFENFKNK